MIRYVGSPADQQRDHEVDLVPAGEQVGIGRAEESLVHHLACNLEERDDEGGVEVVEEPWRELLVVALVDISKFLQEALLRMPRCFFEIFYDSKLETFDRIL